jgi:hypothetical protein
MTDQPLPFDPDWGALAAEIPDGAISAEGLDAAARSVVGVFMEEARREGFELMIVESVFDADAIHFLNSALEVAKASRNTFAISLIAGAFVVTGQTCRPVGGEPVVETRTISFTECARPLLPGHNALTALVQEIDKRLEASLNVDLADMAARQ